MKKEFIIALVIMTGATFSLVQAKDKKDKKNKPVTTEQTVQIKLTSPSDSVSYAAGMAATDGLVPYLQQQLGVDTANMAEFVKGFKEAQLRVKDPAFKAYAAGMQIAGMVNDRIMPSMNNDFVGTKDSIVGSIFNEGFIAALKNDTTLLTQKNASKMFNDRRTAIRDSKNAAYKKENEDWLKTNATKEGMKTTASGLQYKVLVAGKGATPKATDKVTVKYEGRMIDGTVFDSSYKRNPQTTSFRCNEVIKGWTEALTMMPVGSKWEICIPQELAYGSRQAGQIKPYSTLVFTVELVSIDK
jgi:FKBP-type peptidyl-prolyl cis-trans isomerase FklB